MKLIPFRKNYWVIEMNFFRRVLLPVSIINSNKPWSNNNGSSKGTAIIMSVYLCAVLYN